MRQLIKYTNGERRVINAETMTASAFLHHSQIDSPLSEYDLDEHLAPTDLEAAHEVLRLDPDAT